jgi:hypothetical protein
MEWLELIISIFAGLATAIPLVIKLVEYVKKAMKEKNWGIVLNMVMNYMAIAEEKFDNGAERKEWVLAMIQESEAIVNYDIDINVISTMIDNLVSMSKKVNVTA